MEILIFSDSHGSASNMSLALDRQIKTPDAILFLGDGARDLDNLFVVDTPIWAVRGNCDWYSSDLADKTERLLYFEGHTILLCHGHEWGVKSNKIDYIYMTDDLAEKVKRVTAWDDKINGIWLSDHYPVCAEMEL